MTIRYLIIESDDLYSSEYDYVDYLLDIDYKNSPSTLIDIPMSENELGEISYYNTIADSTVETLTDAKNTPIGKMVF